MDPRVVPDPWPRRRASSCIRQCSVSRRAVQAAPMGVSCRFSLAYSAPLPRMMGQAEAETAQIGC
jgi:hypothetical protein